jgi:hypothetical protein
MPNFDDERYGDRFSEAEVESILKIAISRWHQRGYRLKHRMSDSEWVDAVMNMHNFLNQTAAATQYAPIAGYRMSQDEAIDMAENEIGDLMI